MTDAPERIYLDGDVEAGDGMFPRCFESPKYASEPQVEYIRADLATPMRCAECDCEKGGADCNWIATPAPAVKVKALVWQRNGDHHAGGYGYVIRKMGSQYTLTVRNSHGQNFDTIEAAKAAAQAHHDATILAALETATPLDDQRVKALVEAVRHEREMVCQDFDMQLAAARAVDAALSALEENK